MNYIVIFDMPNELKMSFIFLDTFEYMFVEKLQVIHKCFQLMQSGTIMIYLN